MSLCTFTKDLFDLSASFSTIQCSGEQETETEEAINLSVDIGYSYLLWKYNSACVPRFRFPIELLPDFPLNPR